MLSKIIKKKWRCNDFPKKNKINYGVLQKYFFTLTFIQNALSKK
jgi:hypothetical protein